MPLNLLIADDSVTIQKVVDLAFEDEDVNVITAGDGQEALDKVNDVQPDIIIVDTDMPKLNGFELCQKIKENEKLKNISVCLLHSDFEEFDEEKFRSCGADGHLSKPFKSEDIINKVAEITGTTDKIGRDNLADQDDLKSMENLTEDLDELEVLSPDEAEQKDQSGEIIELNPEHEVAETGQDKIVSLEDASNQDLSDDEVAKFMEDLDEMQENELFKESGLEETVESLPAESEKKLGKGLKNELDEFNKALSISEEEMGEVEPLVSEQDEKEKEEAPEEKQEEEKPEEEKQEEEKQEEEKPDLESISDEIEEEKEDLIKETGILPDGEFETPEMKKNAVNIPSEETSPLFPPDRLKVGVTSSKKATKEVGKKVKETTGSAADTPLKEIRSEDFEKIVGGYIKEVIERIIKEAIQNEIAGITDKIVEAVERIAQEITPDISRTIIQDEIKKLKNSEA